MADLVLGLGVVAKVLIVEDDPVNLANVRHWLEHESYFVETAVDGDTAISLLRVYSYDVIVLDWDLPKISGLEVLRTYRQSGGMTPVLMLTGKTQMTEKETGLDSGADDYLTKPFEMRELTARLRSLLRRAARTADNFLQCGGLILEPRTRRVTCGEMDLNLLPKEFALLEFLMRHPDESFTGEALLNRVWTSESAASLNTVKSFVYLLRKKLAAAGKSDLLQTVPGEGYKLVSAAAKAK